MGRKNDDGMEVALLTVPHYADNDQQQKNLEKAEAAYTFKDYKNAKDYCDMVLRTNRHHAEAKHLLGKIAVQEREYVKAAGYYEAIKKDLYATSNHKFTYDCDVFYRAVMSEIIRLNADIQKMPQNNLNECALVKKALDDMSGLLKVVEKFGPPVDSNLVSAHAKVSPNLDYKFAELKYALILQNAPTLLAKNLEKMTEDELTTHLIDIKNVFDLTIEFVTHERGMTEDALLVFDPNSEKHAKAIQCQADLEKRTLETDVALTYKICLREFSNLGLPACIPSTSALLRLERMSKSLRAQAESHCNSKTLLATIDTRILDIKTILSTKNIDKLVAHSYARSVTNYDVAEAEHIRITNALKKTLVKAGAGNTLVYANDKEIETQSVDVASMLSHYYSYKMRFGCCPSNVLQVDDNFESELEKGVAIATPKSI